MCNPIAKPGDLLHYSKVFHKTVTTDFLTINYSNMLIRLLMCTTQQLMMSIKIFEIKNLKEVALG